MLALLSPAKTLDFSEPPLKLPHTIPQFLKDSEELVKQLKTMSVPDIRKLMRVSEKIAELNYERFQQFTTPFNTSNAKQSIITFKGDVYRPLEVETYSKEDFLFAQDHIRSLSGLYGILKPLDLMQAYRLEMGTKLATKRGKNLCDFWGSKVTDAINAELKEKQYSCVLNLASKEYFEVVQPENIEGQVVDVVFKDYRDGKYAIVGIFAKRERGVMANYIIKNRITEPEGIKKFKEDGYAYAADLSTPSSYVFTRKQ